MRRNRATAAFVHGAACFPKVFRPLYSGAHQQGRLASSAVWPPAGIMRAQEIPFLMLLRLRRSVTICSNKGRNDASDSHRPFAWTAYGDPSVASSKVWSFALSSLGPGGSTPAHDLNEDKCLEKVGGLWLSLKISHLGVG